MLIRWEFCEKFIFINQYFHTSFNTPNTKNVACLEDNMFKNIVDGFSHKKFRKFVEEKEQIMFPFWTTPTCRRYFYVQDTTNLVSYASHVCKFNRNHAIKLKKTNLNRLTIRVSKIETICWILPMFTKPTKRYIC